MAIRDTSIDEKLLKAGKEEFLEKGFQNASLREIAHKAGVSTGAMYTRFASKDDFFYHLVSDTISVIEMGLKQPFPKLEGMSELEKIDEIIRLMRVEYKKLLNFMYDHYDDFLLVISKSTGSKLENYVDSVAERKTIQSKAGFLCNKHCNFDLNAYEIIIRSEFHKFRVILEKGLTREEAVKCMDDMLAYSIPGWREFLIKSLLCHENKCKCY